MKKITIIKNGYHKDYEVEIEFGKRDPHGDGLCTITDSEGNQAEVFAQFAGFGGCTTNNPDTIYILDVIKGSLPYFWAL